MTLRTTLFAFLTLLFMSANVVAAGYTLDISETIDDEYRDEYGNRLLQVYIGTFTEDIVIYFGRDYIAVGDLFSMRIYRDAAGQPQNASIWVDNDSYGIDLNQSDPNPIYAVLYHALGPMEQTYSREFLKHIWRQLILNTAGLEGCDIELSESLAQFLSMPLAETETSTVSGFMGYINSMDGLSQSCFPTSNQNQ